MDIWEDEHSGCSIHWVGAAESRGLGGEQRWVRDAVEVVHQTAEVRLGRERRDGAGNRTDLLQKRMPK